MTATRTRALPSEIERGLEVLAATQDEGGSWKGDYGGPLFLVPVYVAGLELLGRPPDPATRDGFVTFLRGHQNPDGGWGLDVESHSHVFTSVLVYVTLRLLGISAGDPAAAARTGLVPAPGRTALQRHRGGSSSSRCSGSTPTTVWSRCRPSCGCFPSRCRCTPRSSGATAGWYTCR